MSARSRRSPWWRRCEILGHVVHVPEPIHACRCRFCQVEESVAMLMGVRRAQPFPFANQEITAIDHGRRMVTIGGLFVLLPDSATVAAERRLR